jgi:hypothetical protein
MKSDHCISSQALSSMSDDYMIRIKSRGERAEGRLSRALVSGDTERVQSLVEREVTVSSNLLEAQIGLGNFDNVRLLVEAGAQMGDHHINAALDNVHKNGPSEDEIKILALIIEHCHESRLAGIVEALNGVRATIEFLEPRSVTIIDRQFVRKRADVDREEQVTRQTWKEKFERERSNVDGLLAGVERRREAITVAARS